MYEISQVSADLQVRRRWMMAREDFFDSLRLADQMFPPMRVIREGSPKVRYFQGDPWLTPGIVEDFDPADFADWPVRDREKLQREVDAFLEIARQVPPNAPAPKHLAKQAREHLEGVMKVVRDRLLPEWLAAQETMLQEAESAAREKGWYVEWGEIELNESLLRTYRAPRLLIRTWDREMMLKPEARFGYGRQGIVDLLVSPTYERAYTIAFKNGRWQIVSLQGERHKRPFSRATFANTISRLSQV